ncbi:MAG: adenine deaminase [Clostridiales bacterium]|jgi:adenine deaminase|nr:adenine deaminase [Clostridiales bacterium]
MIERIVKTALGTAKADLILKNARMINAFTEEELVSDIAISNGLIAGVGEYDNSSQVIDLDGACVSPSFINTHCHVESSMCAPNRYCLEELKQGVGTVITDPHEVANVAGAEGIRFMIDAASCVPVDYRVQLPSCVPAACFESSGAVLASTDLAKMLDWPSVSGLGEMMNYPGVLGCDEEILKKLALAKDMIIDGHAPGLTGRELQAYIAAGIETDHESVTFEEALEKQRAGMAVLIREGSASKNLDAIVTGIINSRTSTDHMAFCTDDKHLADIRREGTIRRCVKRSIELGLPIPQAYKMATINAARVYRLGKTGAIAPGYKADLIALDSFASANILLSIKNGAIVDPGTLCIEKLPDPRNSVFLPELTLDSFTLPKASSYPVIELEKGQITTKKSWVEASRVSELISEGKLCKVAVIERHKASGRIGIGLLSGYGIKGAAASTVGHDSHNLITAGDNDLDMLAAALEVKKNWGGFALAQNGNIVGSLPLPYFGLMSGEDISGNLESLLKEARAMGVDCGIDPFITLSFLTLPVLPDIRITDKGIFDVASFSFILEGRA